MDADHPVLHLMYHRVTNGPSAHPYTVTASRFEEHLRVAASAEQDPTRFFRPVFTFDDGHSSNYGQASSLLTKYGHAGLFFVTAGWIETRPDFMCWSEVKQLYANGHAVGCHGLTHKLLTCCSEAELYRELTVSKELL